MALLTVENLEEIAVELVCSGEWLRWINSSHLCMYVGVRMGVQPQLLQAADTSAGEHLKITVEKH